jgi:hypothetical protein
MSVPPSDFNESFLNEIAASISVDPLDIRLQYLGDARGKDLPTGWPGSANGVSSRNPIGMPKWSRDAG